MIDISKYERLCDEGQSADEVYGVMRDDNLDNRECLSVLKSLFQLTVKELCDVRARYASGAKTDEQLDKYYEELAQQVSDAMCKSDSPTDD